MYLKNFFLYLKYIFLKRHELTTFSVHALEKTYSGWEKII